MRGSCLSCTNLEVHIARLTKERDEQIELVIERLESEKEDLMTQNKKEEATKVNEVVAEKIEVERELKEYKCKFAHLSNAILLVHSSLQIKRRLLSLDHYC